MKYIVNIIIFIVLWAVIATILMAGGIAVGIWDGNVIRPSSWPGVSGIIAIIFAYRLVKRINTSKQWKELFNENQIVETKNETNKEIIKNKKSKLSDFANNLTKLGELREKGLLTEEEFLELKRKIL